MARRSRRSLLWPRLIRLGLDDMLIVPVQVVNTPWGIRYIQHFLLCWQMFLVNRECRRRNPRCWCTYLLHKPFVVHWHRHRCTRVGKRFAHRSICTTPVVRRCSRSIRCRNCPIRWGSCHRWFHLPGFEIFLSRNLGTLRYHQNRIYPLDK